MHLLNLILFRLANLSTVSIPIIILEFLYQYSMCKIHQTIQFFIWSNTVVLRVTFEQSVHGIIVIIIIII